MEKRRLGRTDIFVSSICLGTMTWGQQNTEAEGHAQLDLAWDRGVNFLDTAEMYSIPPQAATQGSTERIIGNWLSARKNRDKVLIATKVAGRNTWDWIREGKHKLTRENIYKAVEGSLQRLQTDYIDLYQIHWPERNIPWGSNPNRYVKADLYPDETPIEETIAVFGDLIKDGKIRHFGLSNESSWGVMRYVAESDKGTGPRPVSLQNAYNLVNRTNEVNLAEIADREQVSWLPYSPLAQGYLTGKYDHGARPAGARTTLFNRGQRYETPNAAEALLAYNTLAREFGVTPALFANAFVTSRPFVTSNIIGATSVAQLNEALESAEFKWTPEHQAAVDALHQKYGNPCP